MHTQEYINELRILDVRPILKSKREPFKQIMNTVDQLAEGEVLLLYAPFKPAPLIRQMKKKGFRHEVKQMNHEYWKVYFYK